MANKVKGSAVAEVKIGPFVGGINRHSDASAIADDECTDIVNFDIDLDGSLKSRPPWNLLNTGEAQTVAGASLPTCRQLILYTGTYGGVRFIIYDTNALNGGGTNYQARIYYVDGPNAGQSNLIATGLYYKAVRYNDLIYLISNINTSHNGQKYDLSTGTVTAVASMPRGYSAAVYKDRLWICGRRGATDLNTSRLYFSNLGNFDTFSGSDFFDVAPGDGDALQDLIVYQDNLVLFKDSASYVLAYDTQPAQASLVNINNNIGVQGPLCIQAYEDSIFLQMHNKIYEMNNYVFSQISTKVPYEFDQDVPIVAPYGNASQSWAWAMTLSLVGDRLYSRFFNRLYVYHLRLRAWSRYDSEDTNIKYLGPIMELDSTNTGTLRGWKTFVGVSALWYSMDALGNGSSGAWKLYDKIFVMEDRYESARVEDGDTAISSTASPVDIECTLSTKVYDVGISHRFKRLFHWGVDCISGRNVEGILLPFSVAYKVTWDELASYQWSQLQTWGYPLFEIPSTSQIQPSPGALFREFIRFPKSLRFRLMQFQVNMLSSGNTTDGPARLYSLTAFVSSKQLVPKAVN